MTGVLTLELCFRVWTGVSERPRKEEASDEDEDTEYFDAMEDSPAFITVTATDHSQHRSAHMDLIYSTYSTCSFCSTKTSLQYVQMCLIS